MADEPKDVERGKAPDVPGATDAQEPTGAAPADGGPEGAGENAAGLSAAASTAREASRSLREGLEAIRNVRAASREHSAGRERVKELRAQIEADGARLAHRDEVEADYQGIVQRQGDALAGIDRQLAELADSCQASSWRRDQLQRQLDELRHANEERLRPYRELMESTKGRSDDTARSLSDLKRAMRNAEQQMADAVKKREQRIAAANRAVDNAKDRLQKIEAEFSSLQKDANAAPAALGKLQGELVAEQAHLGAARDEVTRVTAECQQLVDNAQTHLWTQKQSLETVERQNEDARREADARRGEFEGMSNEALAAEKELEGQISAAKTELDEGERQASKLRDEREVEQSVLDDANQIHATPELTAQLRANVAEATGELERQEAEVARLASTERHLRESTRPKRLLFLGVVLAALVLFIVLLVTLLPH